MHNCHLSNLLEMKIPGPHFRTMASESLGWVPRICIFKRTIIAPHTHPLWHSQAAPWCQGLRTLKLVPVYCWTSFFPPLSPLLPTFSNSVLPEAGERYSHFCRCDPCIFVLSYQSKFLEPSVVFVQESGASKNPPIGLQGHLRGGLSRSCECT